MKVSRSKKEEIERAYDFLIGGKYFEPTGKIPVAKLGKLIEALKTLGDLPAGFTVERLFLAGVTQVCRLTCWTTVRAKILGRYALGRGRPAAVGVRQPCPDRQPVVPGGALADRPRDLHADG